jgi:7,8-dihydro-6-hydroxymethylpterin dimethyltransferase
LKELEQQTAGMFNVKDFVPVPCCFPTCNSVTYALIDGDSVLPLPRVLNVDDYLDYISNRVTPDLGADIQAALEGLWSSSAVPGSDKNAAQFALSCAACGLPGELDLEVFASKVFMIMLQDFMDPWTFNQKNVMKCCKEFLLPGGVQIPFCAYNTMGYREQARTQLEARERNCSRARHRGETYTPPPIMFAFERYDGPSPVAGGLDKVNEIGNGHAHATPDTSLLHQPQLNKRITRTKQLNRKAKE